MKTCTVTVAIVVSVLALGTASASLSSALQEQTSDDVATLAIVDFSSLRNYNSTESIPEKELRGGVEMGAAAEEPVMYGAYSLGPAEEMVPSSEAMPIPVNFPALSLKGQSVEHTTSAGHPLRIPTIFAPQYSGYKFELEGLSQPPGTTLHVSNMTIVDANAEYANMAKSDLLDYFDFGQNSRVCATNSMFVLNSCEGFGPEAFHMWCCSSTRCNIQYSQAQLLDMGLPLEEDLEPLTCHSSNIPADEVSTDDSISSTQTAGDYEEPSEVLNFEEEGNGSSGGMASGAVVVAVLLMAAM